MLRRVAREPTSVPGRLRSIDRDTVRSSCALCAREEGSGFRMPDDLSDEEGATLLSFSCRRGLRRPSARWHGRGDWSSIATWNACTFWSAYRCARSTQMTGDSDLIDHAAIGDLCPNESTYGL